MVVAVGGLGAVLEGSDAISLALPQHLAHLDAHAGEDAREDARLQRLALHARQAGQQRRRRNQVAAEPGALMAALLDDVQLIANLEGQVGGRRGLEWVGAYCEQRGMAPVVSAQAGVIVGEVGERASRAGAACSGWGLEALREPSWCSSLCPGYCVIICIQAAGMRLPWGSGSFSGAR